MRDKMLTLKEAIPNGILGMGLFSRMDSPPWGDAYNADDLDLEFFSKYNDKPVAPILETFYTDNGISETNLNRISNLLLNKFKTQWERKFNLLSINYDPTKNFELNETGTNETVERNTDTISTTNTGTNSNTTTNTDSHTEGETGTSDTTTTNNMTELNTGTDTLKIDDKSKRTITNDNENAVYGFNSVNKVPNDTHNSNSEDNFEDDRTDARTLNLNKTNNGTGETGVEFETNKTTEGTSNQKSDGEFSNTTTGSNVKNIDNTTNFTVTRKGISSAYTVQKLIESEIDLWKWNFMDDVFNDVASVITLPIYEIII